MAATSQTKIVNDALAELGSTRFVTSIHDGSNYANRAKELWDGILRELLEAHPWNFALHRAMLNEDGEAPAFGWTRRFALPADCVRWLPPAFGDDDWFEGEQEGLFILTDAEAPLACRYIRLVEDVTRWSAHFVQAFMLRLAASMAEGITQSEGIKDRLADRAEKMLRAAKRKDGLATGRRRRGVTVSRSDWLSSRRLYAPQNRR